jgi:hypothetical protein
MGTLSASSRMKAWTLRENELARCYFGSITRRKAVIDDILDRDGESRVCSWK